MNDSVIMILGTPTHIEAFVLVQIRREWDFTYNAAKHGSLWNWPTHGVLQSRNALIAQPKRT